MHTLLLPYVFIEGDQKVSVHLMITIQVHGDFLITLYVRTLYFVVVILRSVSALYNVVIVYVNSVESHFATVCFMAIHFYNPCRVGPSTPDLWCITVATPASFLCPTVLAVICLPFAFETGLQSQASPYGIYSGHSSILTGYSSST
jgi:hypothetical protein